MKFFYLLFVVLVMCSVQWEIVLGEFSYKDSKECEKDSATMGSPCLDGGVKGYCDGPFCVVEVKG